MSRGCVSYPSATTEVFDGDRGGLGAAVVDVEVLAPVDES